jgi:hypothetical protein
MLISKIVLSFALMITQLTSLRVVTPMRAARCQRRKTLHRGWAEARMQLLT